MEYILKLGGSILTDKSSENTLSNRFEEILEKVEAGGILVHGAGSFGHPQAERQGLKQNITSGYLEPHKAVKKLNGKVVEQLSENGLKPVPVHTSSIAYRENGETRLQLEIVEKAVKQGFTPVLHGDMILEENGFSVISGDELVALMEKKLETGNAGFCTSEEGVLDNSGNTIDRLQQPEFDDLGNGCSDVTGGMNGKIQQLFENKVEARIFGVEQLEEFFDKKPVGTLVEP